MSINVCTDALVLELLPAARITSVSWLARDPAVSPEWRLAAAVPVNHGTAEEVLAQRPDLVVAGSYTTPATRAILQRLRIKVLVVPPATDLGGIRAALRTVGAAVGAPDRAAALVAEMDERLAGLAVPTKRPRVLGWDGALVAGRGDLFHAIVGAAGGIDLGADGPGSADLETVAWLHPEVLAHPATRPGLRAAALARAAALGLGRPVTYDQAQYGCGTPGAALAAVALRRELAGASTSR